MRRPVAGFVAGAVVAGVAVGPGGPAVASPLDDLKARVADAQRAADEATRRFADGQNRYEALGVEITRLEDRIRAGRGEAAALRVLARNRAIEAYTGRDVAIYDGFIVDGDPLDAIRRERLLAQTKKREDDAVGRLERLTERLDHQRHTVEARRAEQARALDVMRADQTRLQEQLRVAEQAQAQLEAELRKKLEAAQAAAQAAAVARQAHAPAGGGGAPVSSDMICPIRGPVSFTDTFGAPRPQGPHMGVDLMSPAGTPNVAVVSGNVEFKDGPVSGLGARLHGDNGTLYYYFHLSAYEGGPRHVQQGDVIGYVGNTGDASGGPTHTHFEVHPGGGAAVNPYPYVAAVC